MKELKVKLKPNMTEELFLEKTFGLLSYLFQDQYNFDYMQNNELQATFYAEQNVYIVECKMIPDVGKDANYNSYSPEEFEKLFDVMEG